MDSRDYVYAFDIQGLNGAPADFELPSGISNPIAGVFLPQAAPDWLGRRKYPARILLATEEALWVIAHSTACVPPARILLRDLEALECARFLLLGWIGLHTGIGEHVLAYNQRSCDVVDRFLLGIKARWMPRELRFCRVPKQTFGAALDQKFNFAWSSEAIDEHEYPADHRAPAPLVPLPARILVCRGPACAHRETSLVDRGTIRDGLCAVRRSQQVGPALFSQGFSSLHVEQPAKSRVRSQFRSNMAFPARHGTRIGSTQVHGLR